MGVRKGPIHEEGWEGTRSVESIAILASMQHIVISCGLHYSILGGSLCTTASD